MGGLLAGRFSLRGASYQRGIGPKSMASLKAIRTFPALNRGFDAADLRTFCPFWLEKGVRKGFIPFRKGVLKGVFLSTQVLTTLFTHPIMCSIEPFLGSPAITVFKASPF